MKQTPETIVLLNFVCEDIQNATLFASNTSGFAFYYATPKGVFSFSASSGETTS